MTLGNCLKSIFFDEKCDRHQSFICIRHSTLKSLEIPNLRRHNSSKNKGSHMKLSQSFHKNCESIVKISWRFHEYSWIFMKTWWKLGENLVNIHEYSWICMNIHEIFTKFSWIFMNTHEYSWNFHQILENDFWKSYFCFLHSSHIFAEKLHFICPPPQLWVWRPQSVKKPMRHFPMFRFSTFYV